MTVRLRTRGRVHYLISECQLCALSAFLMKQVSTFYRVVNGFSILLYGILLIGVHKVSTVEKLV